MEFGEKERNLSSVPQGDWRCLIKMNKEKQLKAIEAQIAELRGTYNYIMSLKEQGFKVIPPVQEKVES